MIPVVYYKSSTRMSLGKRPEAVKPCLEGSGHDQNKMALICFFFAGKKENLPAGEEQHSRLLECAIILA